MVNLAHQPDCSHSILIIRRLRSESENRTTKMTTSLSPQSEGLRTKAVTVPVRPGEARNARLSRQQCPGPPGRCQLPDYHRGTRYRERDKVIKIIIRVGQFVVRTES